jgi:hypothetical protein
MITFSRNTVLPVWFLKGNDSFVRNESLGLASNVNYKLAVLPIIFFADVES